MMLKYPKLLLLGLSFLLAYTLFRQHVFELLPEVFNAHGYVSVFLAGLLFSFGFTTPFAIFIFIELAPVVNPLLAAPLAGLGAMLADMTLFEFARFSVKDELRRLASTRVIRWLIQRTLYRPSMSEQVRLYLLWSLAGVIIASPLPDEIGVTLLSGVTQLDERRFALVSFGFNTVGIFVMLLGGRAIS